MPTVYNSTSKNGPGCSAPGDAAIVKFACMDCKSCYIPIRNWFPTFIHLIRAKRMPNTVQYCRKYSIPAQLEFDHVLGERVLRKRHNRSCDSARSWSTECGANAAGWTPKHKKDLFRMLTK